MILPVESSDKLFKKEELLLPLPLVLVLVSPLVAVAGAERGPVAFSFSLSFTPLPADLADPAEPKVDDGGFAIPLFIFIFIFVFDPNPPLDEAALKLERELLR